MGKTLRRNNWNGRKDQRDCRPVWGKNGENYFEGRNELSKPLHLAKEEIAEKIFEEELELLRNVQNGETF